MTNPSIHPVALIVIGCFLYRLEKQEINTYSIVGECLAVVFCLSVYPLMKCLLVKNFENIQVVSFGVYFRVMMMLVLGRVVGLVRVWGSKNNCD